MVGKSCLSQALSTTATPRMHTELREYGCLRGLQPSPGDRCCPFGKLSCSVPPRLAHVIMDGCARYGNLAEVNGWGALHLGNGSESQRFDSSWALPHLRAMPSFNQNVRAPSRSGDGALPNSDMRGSETFDDKMFQLLTQRASGSASPSPVYAKSPSIWELGDVDLSPRSHWGLMHACVGL